uniref:Transposase (putative) gypsy type domain-containing protein n=1 Tax=Arundo donax TaxID=35708 RepID=A0A0A9FEH7_ARUDO
MHPIEMAPKKTCSQNKKAAASEAAVETEVASPWKTMTVTSFDLESLVSRRMLPSRSVGWLPTFGEKELNPQGAEIVVFAIFFWFGFALLANSFFHSLLDFYGIRVTHLNPNSVFAIAIFSTSVRLTLGFLRTLISFAICITSNLSRVLLISAPLVVLVFSFGTVGVVNTLA